MSVKCSYCNIVSHVSTTQEGEMMYTNKVLNDSKVLDIQEKLIRIIEIEGSEGILSSQLPKRYFEKYNEKLELTDESGKKFHLKDILLVHPYITCSMYKGVQPKYIYEKPTSQIASSLNTPYATNVPITAAGINGSESILSRRRGPSNNIIFDSAASLAASIPDMDDDDDCKKLEDHCLKNGLSKVEADRIVARCKEGDANQLYKELKRQSKEECRKGQDKVIAGLTVRAGANFRKALELRCICDYVWVHVLGNKGDIGHAQFQWSIKKMIAYCCDPNLSDEQKSDAEALIMALK